MRKGGDGGLIQTGFSQDTNMITSVQTGIPFNTLSNPYPNGFLQPANGSQGLLTGIGTNISFVNPDFAVPYADQWMAGVNVELPGSIGVDLAYVGNLMEISARFTGAIVAFVVVASILLSSSTTLGRWNSHMALSAGWAADSLTRIELRKLEEARTSAE